MCAGKVIWEAGIFTIVVVLSLTAYTFWAARRGKDFSFLGPFLFASLIMLLVFGFIQVRCRPFHSLVRCVAHLSISLLYSTMHILMAAK